MYIQYCWVWKLHAKQMVAASLMPISCPSIIANVFENTLLSNTWSIVLKMKVFCNKYQWYVVENFTNTNKLNTIVKAIIRSDI